MIAQLLALACDGDRGVLERLGGRTGIAAREAADELESIPLPAERAALRARIATAVRMPVPPGIRGVHASWIEAGLVGLPERARGALAGECSEPIDVWLVRWACSEIPPVPGSSAAIDEAVRVPTSIDDALRMSGEALATWLGEIGADQLAHALRKAGVDAVAQVASRVIGDRLVAAAARIDHPPRANELGTMRAAIQRCRGVVVEDHVLVRIGARALAAHVDALARRQLAVRLPRPLGLVVRDELVAHAATPVDQCPTWLALSAAW